ncbi:hypothetical protein [Kangiella shandongensis]|uniref:hypothetical protein n=1 Tax=Kangiella shandongensis TaxID=2763258 RepID=UPI001CC0F24E|nr:hypothetical protein [Kangiella shandongensis]
MIIKRIMVLGALLGFSYSINAASTAEDCAAITDDTKRLKCYDAFLKAQKSTEEAKPAKAAKPEVPQPPAAPVKPEPAEPELTAEERFGAEHLDKADQDNGELDVIKSRALGLYKSWDKGLEVELENGQVWEITDSRSAYYKVKNPKIKVEKGLFGSYMLRIDGLNKGFRVKRVK